MSKQEWKIGNCLDLMKELPSSSVDLIITSPPYPGNNVMWGELYHEENFLKAHDFLNTVWDECLRILSPGCKLCINIANTKRRPYLPNTHKIYQWAENKIEPIGEIIWNKGYGQCGTAWGSFRSPSDPALADQHEYILIFRKYGKRERPDEFEKINCFNFKSWRNSMWNIPPAKASVIGHVASFPLEIPKRLITLYSFKCELVFDPFVGSGAVLRMCRELGRNGIGFEINPEYEPLIKKTIRVNEPDVRPMAITETI